MPRSRMLRWVEAHNTVINNCGQFSMLIQLGGSYNFTHCTFANFWTRSFRNTPAVFIDNSLAANETLFIGDLTDANFTNCIVFGNQDEELGFNNEGGALFNFNFSNSQIRFDDDFGNFLDDPLYDFSDTTLYENIVRGGDPDFLDTSRNMLQVGEETAGNDLGLPVGATLFPLDIIGSTRSNTPDFGAYESIVFPE